LSQTTADVVPLTVAPLVGGATYSQGPLGRLATFTLRVVVALAPAASRTVSVSACEVSLTVVVFHAYVASPPEVSVAPSRSSVYV